MEYDLAADLGCLDVEKAIHSTNLNYKKIDSVTNEAAETNNPIMDTKSMPSKDSDALKLDVNMSSKKGDITKYVDDGDTTGEVITEVFVTTGDIIRAGGLGATDDISSFLPVAVDSTDFEASLRNARDFEEPQGDISRPGLGWTDALKLQVDLVSSINKGNMKYVDYCNRDTTGDVSMEVAVTTNDIVRAGGFGATDDISSFLPVAVDSTDFEASLRDARGFEEPQGKISRPGIGWTEATESESH